MITAHDYMEKEAGFGALKNKAIKVVRNLTGNNTTKRTIAKLKQTKMDVNNNVTKAVGKLGDGTYTSNATKTLGNSMKRSRRLDNLRGKQIMNKV